MLLKILIGGAAAVVGFIVTYCIRTRPIDRGSVSDAWRAENRGGRHDR
jgi:hypothetical protein